MINMKFNEFLEKIYCEAGPDLKAEVIEFLKENPNPPDEAVHDWATSKGYDVHEVEATIYELASAHVAESRRHDDEPSDEVLAELIARYTGDKLPGGKGDNLNPNDFDLEQLKRGITVEQEHTPDLALALEITMDHLAEFEDYYNALADMEAALEARG